MTNRKCSCMTDVMYPLQMMTPFVVMTTTVSLWLLPAAGEVSVNHTWNASSTYDVITEAHRNSSARQLHYYRVGNLLFVYFLTVSEWYESADIRTPPNISSLKFFAQPLFSVRDFASEVLTLKQPKTVTRERKHFTDLGAIWGMWYHSTSLSSKTHPCSPPVDLC